MSVWIVFITCFITISIYRRYNTIQFIILIFCLTSNCILIALYIPFFIISQYNLASIHLHYIYWSSKLIILNFYPCRIAIFTANQISLYIIIISQPFFSIYADIQKMVICIISHINSSLCSIHCLCQISPTIVCHSRCSTKSVCLTDT